MNENGSPPAHTPPLHQRLLLLFASPGRLFDALKDEPVWRGALAGQVVLETLLLTTPIVLLVPRVYEAGTLAATAGSAVLGVVGVLTVLVAVLSVPLFYGAIAGVLFIAARFITPRSVSFTQLFSVTIHAAYVLLLGRVIALVSPLSDSAILSPPRLRVLQPASGADFAAAAPFSTLLGMAFFALLGVALCRVCRLRRVVLVAACGSALYLVFVALAVVVLM